jgi:PrtD family type I secretion system ABC transporter
MELRNILKKFRGAFFAVLIFSMIINLLVLISPLYMLQIYDRVLISGSSETLLLLSIIAIFLLVLLGVLEVIRSRILVRVSLSMDDKLSNRIFDSIFASSLVSSSSNQSQSIRDLGVLRQFMTGTGLFAFFDAPWTPLYIAVIFSIHPWLGFLSLAGAILIFILALATEIVSRTPLKEAAQNSSLANTFTESSLRNAETLQALGMLDPIKNRWRKNHDAMLLHQAVASDRVGLLLGATKALRISLQVGILGIGAYLALDQIITPGAMIAGSIIMGRALAPVEQAIGAWRGFVGARGGYHRLNQLLAYFPEKEKSMPLPKPKGILDVEHLVGMPPGVKKAVLQDLNFHLDKGENIAVVGQSAAGKSTLARMLVGVWKPAHGVVRLDKADVSAWNREDLGPHIGYLPQNIELFAGSVKDNIARFETVVPEKVLKAATKAGAHEMILQLPEGYDTVLGDGGAGLSGGQKQRVALARALYGDPSFILLDEPNSNLDAEGKEKLIESIKKLKEEGVTLIVVTHDVPVIAALDKVLMLREGRIEFIKPSKEVLKPEARTPKKNPAAPPVTYALKS